MWRVNRLGNHHRALGSRRVTRFFRSALRRKDVRHLSAGHPHQHYISQLLQVARRRSLIAAFKILTTVQDTACRYTLTAELGQVRGSVVTVFG